MKVFRVHLTSWTSSFRYPNMISGYQPTLPVPPLSTINGLISAAMGRYFAVSDEKLGYVFLSGGKAVDLETIYPWNKDGKLSLVVKGKRQISNIVKREFLFDNDLILYSDSSEIANAFRKPQYQLLLGRSGDLAKVNSVEEIESEEKATLDNLKGTIVPFSKYPLPASIQALPICFSNEIPRRNIGTQPYCLLPGEYKQKELIEAPGIEDTFKFNRKTYNWDIYWQEI